MKLDKRTIGMVLAVGLIIAQQFGVVPTVTPSVPAEPCAECPRCGETEVDGGQ